MSEPRFKPGDAISSVAELINAICDGRFIILSTQTRASIVNGRAFDGPRVDQEFDRRILVQTLEHTTPGFGATPLLCALTKRGDPPPEKRKRGEGYRMGWKELELPDPGPRGVYYVVMV